VPCVRSASDFYWTKLTCQRCQFLAPVNTPFEEPTSPARMFIFVFCQHIYFPTIRLADTETGTSSLYSQLRVAASDPKLRIHKQASPEVLPGFPRGFFRTSGWLCLYLLRVGVVEHPNKWQIGRSQ
jgi:hypothetical protein